MNFNETSKFDLKLKLQSVFQPFKFHKNSLLMLRFSFKTLILKVIESTTKVVVSPLKMDFVGVEHIEMKHSKFNNQWHKVISLQL